MATKNPAAAIAAAIAALMSKAEEVEFPELEALKQSLEIEEPAEQWTAIKTAARFLGEHTGQENLVEAWDVMRNDISPHDDQKTKLLGRNAGKIPELVKQLSKKKEEPPPGGAKPPEGNGQNRPRPKRGRYDFASDLRFRLLSKSAACKTMGIDLQNKARYPHDLPASIKMDQNVLVEAFGELEKANMGLFRAPSAQAAIDLNQVINEERRDYSLDLLIAQVTESFRDDARRLVAVADDQRILRMLTQDFVTAALVQEMTAAHARVLEARVASNINPVQPAPGPKPPTAGAGGGTGSENLPATSGEGKKDMAENNPGTPAKDELKDDKGGGEGSGKGKKDGSERGGKEVKKASAYQIRRATELFDELHEKSHGNDRLVKRPISCEELALYSEQEMEEHLGRLEVALDKLERQGSTDQRGQQKKAASVAWPRTRDELVAQLWHGRWFLVGSVIVGTILALFALNQLGSGTTVTPAARQSPPTEEVDPILERINKLRR